VTKYGEHLLWLTVSGYTNFLKDPMIPISY